MPRQETVSDWLKAIALWLMLAFSLGWYYTFTYFGTAALGAAAIANPAQARAFPMPYPEALAGILLYYFSVLNVRTEIQALHWMAVFPAVGVIWVYILNLTSKSFGGRRAHFTTTLVRFGLAALPLSLAGFWLAYEAGAAPGGWRLARMLDVALRRGAVMPWPSLNYVYLALALISLAIQVRLYLTAFATQGTKALSHYLSSLAILAILALAFGFAIAIPLRGWLE